MVEVEPGENAPDQDVVAAGDEVGPGEPPDELGGPQAEGLVEGQASFRSARGRARDLEGGQEVVDGPEEEAAGL